MPSITSFFGGSIGAGVPFPIFENRFEQYKKKRIPMRLIVTPILWLIIFLKMGRSKYMFRRIATPGKMINIKAPVIIANVIDVNFHIHIFVTNHRMIKKYNDCDIS